MAAASSDRNTVYRDGYHFVFPVAASTAILAGIMVGLLDGHLVPASADTDINVVGMSEENIDNSTGDDGDESARVTKKGIYRFFNSASADEITRQDIGSPCYVVDNQTVAKTHASNTRPKAGTIADVDSEGVWISFK